MANDTQLLQSDGKSTMSEQELNEWKMWAEKWLAEESKQDQCLKDK
jgi:hypothetical protein